MPGLGDALRASVTGMQSQAANMSALADNTSNSQTVGFKEALVRFSTFALEAGTRHMYSAGGVVTNVFREVERQGQIEGSSAATHLGIQGSGMFITSTNPTSPAALGEYLFTRAGQFEPDKDGYLINTGGFYLQGWKTDDQGVPLAADLTTLANLQTVNIDSYNSAAKPTTNIQVRANLGASISSIVGTTVNHTVQVFDSLGIPHDVQLTWTRGVFTPNTWRLNVTSADAASITQTNAVGANYANIADTANTPNVVFGGNSGEPSFFAGCNAATATMPDIYIQWNNAVTAAPNSSVVLNLGTIGTLTGITSFGENDFVNAIRQNGATFGNLTSVAIGKDGLMYASYSNGTVLPLYKIPLAYFQSPNNLENRSGNAYAANRDAGDIVIHPAADGVVGTIQAGAVESSTVDLASQFSNMIIAQQAYAANSTSIRTVNEMLEETMRLKR